MKKIKKNKTIYFFTGKRGGFSHFIPILRVLDGEQSQRATKLGVKNLKKKYYLDEMVKGDVIFCATAVTDGDLVKGIIDKGDSFQASTFALHKSTKTIKKVTNVHKK